ncbi:hypothetical protein TB2_023657 [Malus domestica]
MADSVHDSTKSCVGESSCEGKDKSRANAYAELRYDIGGLVQNQCSTEFKSSKMVPGELRKSMVGELSVHWDVDEIDEKQQKYLDDIFKMHFQLWKFDMERAAERAGVPDALEEED